MPPADKYGKSKYFRSAIQLTPKSKYLEVEAICLFYKGKVSKDYVTNVGVTIKTDGAMIGYNLFITPYQQTTQ